MKKRLIVGINQWGARREWAVSLQSEDACLSIYNFEASDVGEAKARMYGAQLAEMIGAEIGDGTKLLLWPKLAEALGLDDGHPALVRTEDKTSN